MKAKLTVAVLCLTVGVTIGATLTNNWSATNLFVQVRRFIYPKPRIPGNVPVVWINEEWMKEFGPKTQMEINMAPSFVLTIHGKKYEIGLRCGNSVVWRECEKLEPKTAPAGEEKE